MPYLIKVIYGKENKLTRLFAREGIELVRIPVSEYLICHDPRCQELRHLDTMSGYIINLEEISDEQASSLLVQNTGDGEEENIEIGNIVTVTDGEYQGQNGVVRKVTEKEVNVDILLFGRMHMVCFAKNQVRLPVMPEAWS